MSKKIVLACANCLSRNYSTTKDQAKADERLKLKKFCKVCNRHTEHLETK